MDYISTDDPVHVAGTHIATAIIKHLSAGEKVLWIMSGGSGVDVVLDAARQLQNINLSNLYVTLSDERYGNLNHINENWKQLLDGGFSLPGATLYRPLKDADIIATTDEFNAWVMEHIQTCNYRIGLFGIGGDGHTAGIKPHSSAVRATTYVNSFIAEDFERITITPTAIRQLDEAIVQASGLNKAAALQTLLRASLTIDDQPAQILKQVKTCTLYTDSKEL